MRSVCGERKKNDEEKKSYCLKQATLVGTNLVQACRWVERLVAYLGGYKWQWKCSCVGKTKPTPGKPLIKTQGASRVTRPMV